MPLEEGKRIGPYVILNLIGRGGMGEVYRAHDQRLRRDVAVKVLPSGVVGDAARLRRFEQEARLAGMLNHPNIVAVYDIGEENGAAYVVSELLEGEDLRRRLNGGALTVRTAIAYARQIANGLAAAHHKGVVHRDLKPENIFLTGDGQLKILDFGLAKLVDRPCEATADATATLSTEPGMVMGTAGYMSPEQLRGEAVDHRTDIFALGAILYEMLTGNRAFAGNTAADRMSATLHEDPEFSRMDSIAPPALAQVVRHCLEKRPEERFESARDLGFALETLTGIGAAPAPAARARARRIWPVLTASVALALAAAWFAGTRMARRDLPSYHRLTFRRGLIPSARFAPDGGAIVYAAAWEGRPVQMFSTRADDPESRPFDIPNSNILAISRHGEMALTVNTNAGISFVGTLARAPLGGGAPREIAEDVSEADWSRDGSSLAAVHPGRSWRLEYPLGKPIYHAPPNHWISHPRVSPKGDLVAFCDHDANLGDAQGVIAVVDLTGHIRHISKHFLDLSGLSWSPGGDEVWATVATRDYEYLLAAFTLGGRQRDLLTSTTRITLYDAAPDGRLLLGQGNIVSVVRGMLVGEREEHDLSWLDGSYARSMSDDGGSLAFDEEGSAGRVTASVYLRKAGGATPIRLGDGFAIAISPDGRWVLASYRHTNPRELWALPTGPGEPVRLPTNGIDFVEAASWFPDSRRVAILGAEPNRAQRTWAFKLDGGKPEPLTPEGMFGWLLSPDGKYVVALDARTRKRLLFPTAGGDPVALTAAAAGLPMRFTPDGRSLFVHRGSIPAEVYRVDLTANRATLVRTLMPPDPAGLIAMTVNGMAVSGDGKYYAYTSLRRQDDLYLVSNVK